MGHRIDVDSVRGGDMLPPGDNIKVNIIREGREAQAAANRGDTPTWAARHASINDDLDTLQERGLLG